MKLARISEFEGRLFGLSRETKEFLLMLFAIVCLGGAGTGGYMLIEGWSFLDSIFMTVTTLATVGFGEVHPLSPNGQVFTIVLIIGGVGVATIVLSSLTQIVVRRQVGWLLDREKMQKEIDKLSGHVILCGFGRLSKIAALDLVRAGTNLVVIEQDDNKLQEAKSQGLLVLQGDATTDETLISAGIKRAQRLVSLLSTDADNLYVILTAKELNTNIFIVSRAEDEIGEKRLTRAGASRVIAPYRIGGQKIADAILRPYVMDFIDLRGATGELCIEQIKIPEKSNVHGNTLQSLGIRQKTNIMVAAIISRDGKMLVNPAGDTVLEAGTTMIGLGMKKDFVVLEELLMLAQ